MDVLAREGRIERIAPTGSVAEEAGIQVLDAGGRIAIPGLMELHAHFYTPATLPAWLYYGVTTIRDQGSRIATLVGDGEAIAAGVIPGPRVSYGGFQFYTDWPYDGEQWRGIEPEADPRHVERSVALAQALGSHHVKTRTFRRWDINARIIEAAHRRGMRATGHCAHALPLIAARMDAQEHLGSCTGRGSPFAYDDVVQLFRATGVSVVPTLMYGGMAIRISRDQGVVADEGLDPWEPITEGLDWMLGINAENRARMEVSAANDREMVKRLHDAGIRLGSGTDVWQVPWSVHLELEELVRSGLSPLEAIHVATGASAEILGADELGTIEEGKWADFVILDADPLADIRNTHRVHTVVKGGEVVDRAAIRELTRLR
jgi:hypothetical protein